MEFGKTIGTACSTFAITNIDDIFVLVTFFAEATTNQSITPFQITIGQYLGFSAIIIVSMIGFGVAFVLPAEPIGFLGLLPVLLGVWKGLHLVFPVDKESPDGDREARNIEETRQPEEYTRELGRKGWWTRFSKIGLKSISSVAMVSIINGGDNIGTYVPLFSQAKGAEIAIYVVIYYVLLGVWILVAWLIMKQKHILHVAERWAGTFIPFLYVGLGIFIVVKSECYPWSIQKINETVAVKTAKVSIGISTAVFMLACIVVMTWFHWKKHAARNEANIH